MKDYNYVPFERNRYFYGKLLSVEDFQREQAYMNHKRCLLNRLLYGDGILCGMQVFAIDEESISVEMGVALDALGREIVIAQPVVKRLSVLDGFREYCVEQENNGFLYLCIDYQEEEAEPVHSIGASGNEDGKHLEYNKWKEGYHLFLTGEEPDGNHGFPNQAYEEVKTIYHDSGLRIRQAVPRFLEKNQDTVIRLFIDKHSEIEPIAFRYEMELTGADYQGQTQLQASFRESDMEPAEHYTMEYVIRAAAGELDGNVKLSSGSFVLEVGEYKQNIPIEGEFHFRVIAGSRDQAVWDAYYQTAAEDILNPVSPPPLYLARISVIQAGDTYVLDGVENLPYGQYVWNNRLLGTFKQIDMLKKKYHNRLSFINTAPIPSGNPVGAAGRQKSFGVTEISLGIGGTVGQTFYSEEIIHGLGPGIVFVTVGAVCPKKQEREIVYGTRSIFPEEKGQMNLETAVKLQVDRGSFVIGVRCLEEVHEDRAVIYWMAVREKEDMGIPVQQTLVIRPNMPRICVRQSIYLEALVGGERQTRIQWDVRDTEGGSIDESGRYTAPNRAGIYEVHARSIEDETLEAMAYVIVGEEP